MSEKTDNPLPSDYITQELKKANPGLAIDLSNQVLPLDMQIRSIALTIAQRHCGDTTVKEGNLYQQLKMDNKLIGPLTVDHVIHAAMVFERFLWGEWSKGLVSDAMGATLNEAEEALKAHFKDEPPTRPHSGGDAP